MDFYSHAVYLIEPRSELEEWLRARVPAELASVLLEPFACHQDERADANWTAADRLAQVKLIALLSFHSQFRDPVTLRFETVFGVASLDESVFDRWWTIRRNVSRFDAGQWTETLRYAHEQVKLPTGNARVDDWLRDMRLRRPNRFAAVLFHSRGELAISPLVQGSWSEPPVDVLVAAGAAGGIGNMVDDVCAGFIAWCGSHSPPLARLSVANLPGTLTHDGDDDPFEWYDHVLAQTATWEHPPYLVDLDQFVIRHRGEIVWPAEKKGRPEPAEDRGRRPGSPFPWGWTGTNLGPHRAGDFTYGDFSYDGLPPLREPLAGTFQWLDGLPEHKRSIGLAVVPTALDLLLMQIPRGLPTEFITFMRNPAFGRRIRSCTDCYLHLDHAAVEIHGGHGKLVRFLSDSQDCRHWNLHILPDGERHQIVTTYRYTGSDEALAPRGRPYPGDITVCAASFEEFLYRFWLENEIWYALHDEGRMPKHGDAYLAHYAAK